MRGGDAAWVVSGGGVGLGRVCNWRVVVPSKLGRSPAAVVARRRVVPV